MDESTLNETCHTHYRWVEKQSRANVEKRQGSFYASLNAAVTSEGQCFLSVSQGYNNSSTTALFISHLAQSLDESTPGWQERAVVLMDNAAYLKSKIVGDMFATLGVQFTFTAPYSFALSPVEGFFFTLKKGDWVIQQRSL